MGVLLLAINEDFLLCHKGDTLYGVEFVASLIELASNPGLPRAAKKKLCGRPGFEAIIEL